MITETNFNARSFRKTIVESLIMANEILKTGRKTGWECHEMNPVTVLNTK